MEWNQLIRRGVMVEKWIESRGQDLTGTITSTERERDRGTEREDRGRERGRKLRQRRKKRKVRDGGMRSCWVNIGSSWWR
jgi:hypothetical protein